MVGRFDGASTRRGAGGAAAQRGFGGRLRLRLGANWRRALVLDGGALLRRGRSGGFACGRRRLGGRRGGSRPHDRRRLGEARAAGRVNARDLQRAEQTDQRRQRQQDRLAATLVDGSDLRKAAIAL
ncbi:MAG: hypothetical protein H6872_01435 [Methylobacteriaceae bacterium]|nr:hypothetical protein [Methylobacteriaceae bacterium]